MKESIDLLLETMTPNGVSRFIKKGLKLKYRAGQITKREYKQSKKLLKGLLK